MKSKVSSPKVLNIVLCIVILLVFVLALGTRTNAEVLTDSASEVIPLGNEIGYKYKNLNVNLLVQQEEPEEENKLAIVLDLNYYLDEYVETIKFFSKLFDYNYDDIIKDFKDRIRKRSF